MKEFVYIASFKHGSQDSQDEDILYMCEPKYIELTSTKQFQINRGTEDRNVMCVEKDEHTGDSYIKSCLVGSPDELNNGLLETFHLHKQCHPIPITTNVKRNVVLKCCTTLTGILVKIRRTMHRDKVVRALKSFDFDTRRKTLSEIDFLSLKDDITINDLKFFAFRLGQANALVKGVEVFTKDATAQTYPELQPLLYRDKDQNILNSLSVVNDHVKILLDAMKNVKVNKKSSMHMFQLKNGYVATNFFECQSQGMVLDLKDQTSMMYWPLDLHLSCECTWVNIDSFATNITTNCFFCYRHSDKFIFSSFEKGFNFVMNKAHTEKFIAINKNLFYENYYYVFDCDTMNVVAKRSRLHNRCVGT
ncbi:hypothetical protein AKO1_004757 [Acrasis kona]|uniref:Uncharacterized protein n=1 Tax=Acrasis kona TaxID=1008807 RepID=A0AAW2Z4L6_9EUKA